MLSATIRRAKLTICRLDPFLMFACVCAQWEKCMKRVESFFALKEIKKRSQKSVPRALLCRSQRKAVRLAC